MKKIVVFLFLFFVKVNSFAESNNLTLLCEGPEEMVFYPIEKNKFYELSDFVSENIIDETVSRHVTVTYNIKNNVLVSNHLFLNNAKCDFRENTINCRMQDNDGNYRAVTIDRISGSTNDDNRTPFEVNGNKSVHRHFEGVCKTAKKKF